MPVHVAEATVGRVIDIGNVIGPVVGGSFGDWTPGSALLKDDVLWTAIFLKVVHTRHRPI